MVFSIALQRPGAIGDILMSLNGVYELRKKYPDAIIDYFCHPSYGEALAPLFKDAGVTTIKSFLDFNTSWRFYSEARNLVGYSAGSMKRHLINSFALDMGLEEFDTLPSLIVTSLPEVRLPRSSYITLHHKSGWSMYKDFDRWHEVIRELPLPVYQIGTASDPEVEGANHIFMGRPICDAMALMSGATCHIGIDSFSNHFTHFIVNGRKLPAVILWGSTQISASGYAENTNLSANLPCSPCFKEDPRISADPKGICDNPPGQTYEKPQHACMAAISTDSVIKAIQTLLNEIERR